METFSTVNEIRAFVTDEKRKGNTIGFVPTMGFLHEGHLSLMRTAREQADTVIVSIYVNPTQFAPGEDYEAYPRNMERDLALCEEEGVAAVFTPGDEVMYGGEEPISISIDGLNEHLCGAKRPGHFEGVLTVVNKLFNVVSPDCAVFGQKDIQQYIIIEKMVEVFKHGIRIVRGDIVRANDGLALSSRNAYLTKEQRRLAPGLYRALSYVEKQIRDGAKNTEILLQHQRQELEKKGFEVDYLQIVNYNDLAPVSKLSEANKYILAGAVYVGETRLIDNLILEL